MTKRKIGILGGGQLGKMICQAGSKLSLDMACLDPAEHPPAALVCPKIVRGDFKNYEDVISFGSEMDIVTIEIENVNTDALEALEAQGKSVYPQSKVIKLIKDKGLQKMFYKDMNIPSSEFRLYDDKAQIESDIENGSLSLPFVQKMRTGGYDGKGVQLIDQVSDLESLFDQPSVVEQKVDIKKELSVIVARSSKGEIKTYPLVEMEFNHDANLVEFLFSPADVDAQVREHAIEIACKVAESLEIIGLLAVELFYNKEGEILVNEVAPRTHNSGHHTIEACSTSQFEQQLRAISGFPLGDTELRYPAVMLNLLGETGYRGKAKYEGLDQLLSISRVHPHIYGKEETKPFRKMGHITVTGEELSEVIQKARNIKDIIKVIT